MMLDPMGKAYYWLIHEHTKELKRDFGYGFYQHRRREQAILVNHAVTGRLVQAARDAVRAGKNDFSFVITLRDISNAFPSLSHDCMRQVLEAHNDEWTAAQLRARHEQLEFRITTKQGESIILKNGCGGAQGDKVMPVQFRRVYEGLLEEWVDTKEQELDTGVKAKDPLTAKVVDVSMTSYADDVKEINVVKDDQEALETIARSGVLLDQVITKGKLKQNIGKAEHVATFIGPGQDTYTKGLKNKFEDNQLGDLKRAQDT